MFLVKYVDQVSDFDMNHQKKTNLDFCDTAKNLYFNYKNKTVLQIIKIKQERYRLTYYRYIFHIYSEYIYKNYLDIASPLRWTYSNEGFSQIII